MSLQPAQTPGLFVGRIPAQCRYRLRIRWPGDIEQETEDPYAFGLLLGELDLYLLAEGTHRSLGQCLGSQAMSIDGIHGVRFAVWAPNAHAGVRGVGEFNGLGRPPPSDAHARRGGVWELFNSAAAAPARSISTRSSDLTACCRSKPNPSPCKLKTPPRTASIVADPAPLQWNDAGWLEARAASGSLLNGPLSIYEGARRLVAPRVRLGPSSPSNSSPTCANWGSRTSS